MDRMLVVVFDNEAKAYEGKKALLQLDNEGSISVYAYAVLTKNADGTASIKQGDDPGPLGTLLGTSLGSLIGLLGGPAGVALGATLGFGAGSAADIDNARIGDDFITDVTKQLSPNRVAVVAEIEEDWTTPVDIRSRQPVTKALRSRTPAEGFLFGAVYIHAAPESYVKFARDYDRLRKLPSNLALGVFSYPPQPSDFKGLAF